MIKCRPATERGKTETSWLNSFHTFSFGHYHDPKYQGWGNLLVINEDTVQPGMGFNPHSHQDMEIISYVVQGELAHKDSMGNGSVIKHGEIQKMSAGTGIQHSEFNHSPNELLHFLQIWIIPNKTGITPAYEQKNIPIHTQNKLLLIGSPKGDENAISIQQNVHMYAAYLTSDAIIEYNLTAGQSAWLQVVKGKLELNNEILNAGDGAAIEKEAMLKIHALSDSEVLLIVLE